MTFESVNNSIISRTSFPLSKAVRSVHNKTPRKRPLFPKDRSGCVHCRALSPHALESAYRLVYKVYVQCGYVTPSNTGLRMRAFEMCPETATFVSKSPSSDVVGVISVVVDSPDLGLPSEAVFKKEIEVLRKEGGKLCEFSNQVVTRDYRITGANGELVRAGYAHAVHVGCTDIVASVSPGMIPFYNRMGFEVLSEVRSYSDVIDDPVVFIRLPRIHTRYSTDPPSSESGYDFCKSFLYDDNPYYAIVPVWIALNDRMFTEGVGISSLFGKCPEVTIGGSELIRESLSRRLGPIYDLSTVAAKRISSFSTLPPSSFCRRPCRVSFITSRTVSSHIRGNTHKKPLNVFHKRAFNRISAPPPRLFCGRLVNPGSKMKNKPDATASAKIF